MNYQVIYNPVTRRYRIRKLRNHAWVHTFWDLGTWADETFETRWRWRARYLVWWLNRMDAQRERERTWEP